MSAEKQCKLQVPAREVCDKLRRKLSLKALMALCEMTAKYTEYWRRNANMALLVTALCAEMKKLRANKSLF